MLQLQTVGSKHNKQGHFCWSVVQQQQKYNKNRKSYKVIKKSYIKYFEHLKIVFKAQKINLKCSKIFKI